ncbi:RidA family protein [Vagococcus sp. BWB3-3]|uniref:RidA family protein n=1 Tax=Vagococcus allomyrinae TaxID=2794353 RepID=A0A940SWD4_9ENTE|nr:Rid family detoxifying hydrolase [Vagococcus allomyrinae]MBP1041981.1 RidA family protein [Vagococcus allomyrinae]
MTNTIINADQAPAAVGPYSHSVLADKTLYVSGQLGLNPNGDMGETVAEQTDQALINLGEILKTAGFSYNDIVKTTIFVTNMGDFATVNDSYGRYFEATPPARSCVQVGALPKAGLVEIEAVAVKQ